MVDLISVLRRPDGLYAYRVRRRENFPIPGVSEGADLSSLDPFTESIGPLRGADFATAGAVLESWDALKRVRKLDASTLFHVVNVLLHSLPDDGGDGAVAPLTFAPAPPAFRPTAANPRAYKGTKDRPPKPGRPRDPDLRPHLASPRDVNALIVKLAPFQEQAGRLLRKADVLGGELPPLVDAKGRARDVYLACLHRAGDRSLLSLPAPFRRGFLFWRRGEPWRTVGRLLAIYWALDLERRPALRRCLERPLAFQNLDWLDLLLERPLERQTAFAELVIETGVGDCPRGMGDVLKRLDEISPDGHYQHRTYALLRTVRDGGNLAHLMAGFELSAAYHPKEVFEPVGDTPTAPVDAIRAFVDAVSAPWLAPHMWRACGELDGMAELLTSVPWLDLPTSSAKQLVDLLCDTVYADSPHIRDAKWAILRDLAPKLLACVKGIPAAYQDKALRHLKRLDWYWDDPEDLAWSLREYLEFLPRLCRPPFLPEGFEEKIFAPLTHLPDEEWDKISGAPDDVLRKLERACRRDNDATLIAGGLYYLRRHAAGHLAEGVVRDPSALLRAARILGGLGKSVRRETLERWTRHPLQRDDLSLEELLKAVPAALDDVVPRKLKRGMSSLGPGQKAWGREKIARALPNLRWRLLAHLCLEALRAQVKAPARSGKELHALRLYGNIDGNRRALRLFLRAHFAGDKDYLLSHPLNLEWLRRQPMVRSVWLDGMEMDGKRADGTPLKLHIELDPLEALRLGTYVGSCTGHGGRFAYSAAAVVLDLNKHVVYARDAAGRVVGRQLLGVSEEGELVAFEVYPVGAAADLRELFRDFDIEFARRLKIPIHRPERTIGHVVPLLSKEWWDDGAWDVGQERTTP